MIFASSPYINADHILRTYNTKESNSPDKIELKESLPALIKFCILYLPESNITTNLDIIWKWSANLTASLCFALQSPRFIGSLSAFSKRATILQWFPKKLT